MIRVERNQVDEAGQPIRPNDDWFTTAAEKTVEAEAEQGDHEVTDHYKDVQIKIALEKLFNFKCAYCERDLSPPWDVEHFRPKGRVAERREHPGYYWLAYEWTNLYPSCQNCNQRRKDQPVWGNADLTPGPAAGKLDQFPLVVEANRAMDHTMDIADEEPELLDPCNDTPEEVISFDPTGEAFSLDDNPRGVRSIEIYHLNRRKLIDRRLEKQMECLLVMERIKANRDSGDTGAVAILEDIYNNLFRAATKPYAGLARAIWNDPAAFGV